jgi:hypothetical protein
LCLLSENKIEKRRPKNCQLYLSVVVDVVIIVDAVAGPIVDAVAGPIVVVVVVVGPN